MTSPTFSNLTALTEALRKRKLAAEEATSVVNDPIWKHPSEPKITITSADILKEEQEQKLNGNIPVSLNLSAPSWKEQFPAGQSLAAKIAALRLKRSESYETSDSSSDISSISTNKGTETESNAKPSESTVQSNQTQVLDKYGNLITYNSKQESFIFLTGISGRSAVLIGAAGTGKTTAQKGVVTALINSGAAGILSADGHKHLISGNPGIIVCAYTRRAVANIRKNVPEIVQNNCITIHKLLEYQPVYYSVFDETSGEEKKKMVFEATRHAGNPLPSSIHTIIFEESSMLGTDLYKEVIDACPHNPQLIFLGDIQQLPPVFGPAILGFKLLELPVIELTEVYRQALESPIISLAHRILSGNPIPPEEFPKWKFPNQLTIHPWKKKIEAQNALQTAAMFFVGTTSDTGVKTKGAFQNGFYDPAEDIILIPFNKAFGTDELNKFIANALARHRGDETYEIIAGFNKLYLSPNDKVLYDKEDATVLSIEHNPAYSGALPQSESTTLDYWGFDPVFHKSTGDGTDVDFLLAQVANNSSEDRVNQASHIITLRMNDSDATVKLTAAGDLNALLLGYALTVHKSQGSEWRKVFFICHQSHATMLQRELLYTAVTRAREELYIICEPETFVKGIISQRVKGDTLEEKAEVFKGKIADGFKL